MNASNAGKIKKFAPNVEVKKKKLSFVIRKLLFN